ncbi:MAG: DUF4446 family protein [Anaerolineae bacterium]|nr:DUF4446 family protein [Anaerolineae bacterium]
MDSVLIPWVVATTILMFVAAYWIYTLETRVRQFQVNYETLLKISEALEAAPDKAALQPLAARLDAHDARINRTESEVRAIQDLLPRVIRGVGIVRYNAFEGIGGDQSFSVALVDGRGHGAVISGLHTGEGVRVYAKPLENWKSSYSLSADEQKAMGLARQSASSMPPDAG